VTPSRWARGRPGAERHTTDTTRHSSPAACTNELIHSKSTAARERPASFVAGHRPHFSSRTQVRSQSALTEPDSPGLRVRSYGSSGGSLATDRESALSVGSKRPPRRAIGSHPKSWRIRFGQSRLRTLRFMPAYRQRISTARRDSTGAKWLAYAVALRLMPCGMNSPLTRSPGESGSVKAD
jgi:hypothetical protein